MKLYRYMSIIEFAKICAGKDMQPFREEFGGANTDSKGFCFLGEKIKSSYLDKNNNNCTFEYTPEQAIKFLPVASEVLVEFETTEDIDIHESWGQYNNPLIEEEGCCGTHIIDEYYCDSYNNKSLIPTRYSFDLEKNKYRSLNSIDLEWLDYNEDTRINIREFYNKVLDNGKTEFFPTAMKCLQPGDSNQENEMFTYSSERKGGRRKEKLIYGDPINDNVKYEMSFIYDNNLKSWELEENDNIPEFWEHIYNNYKSDGKTPSNIMPSEVASYAAIIATYPNLVKILKLDNNVITSAFGTTNHVSISMKDNETEYTFEIEDIGVQKKEDGSLDVSVSLDTAEGWKDISLLSVMRRKELEDKKDKRIELELESEKIYKTESLMNQLKKEKKTIGE